MPEPIKTVHIPKSLHQQLRVLAAERGTTLRDETEAAIKKHISDHRGTAPPQRR